MNKNKIYGNKSNNKEETSMGMRGLGIGDWGLGIGDWGSGDWGQSPRPNPQCPMPNPHHPDRYGTYLPSMFR